MAFCRWCVKQFQKRKNMKKVIKVLVFVAAVVLFGSSITSCKSTQDCSAYGEVKKFQKESRR